MRFDLLCALLLTVAIGKACTGISSSPGLQMSYDSGRPFAVGGYLNGKKHGSWAYYYENGELFMAGRYDIGLCDGMWFVFDRSGKAYSGRLGALICDEGAFGFQMPGLDFLNWDLLNASKAAQELLPTLENGWQGAGRYDKGILGQ